MLFLYSVWISVPSARVFPIDIFTRREHAFILGSIGRVLRAPGYSEITVEMVLHAVFSSAARISFHGILTIRSQNRTILLQVLHPCLSAD